MIEPTLALQTAMRSALVNDPAIAAFGIPADHIRAGSTRPEKTPCIVMGEARTALHGHDYTAHRAAWVYLDVHVWTLNEGPDLARQIAFAVSQALGRPLPIDGARCTHLRVTNMVFPRDPKPEYGHGVLSVEALIEWTV
jgi:hypothetical protein